MGAVELIGREKERSLLLDVLGKVGEGKGKNVLISGEAGIGKSTLIDFLEDEARKTGMIVCKGECTEQELAEPYHPFDSALAPITDEALFTLEEFTKFSELFLISNVGLLIANVSSSAEEGIDEDILSSMLTAVQDFVKDSFGGIADEGEARKGGLGKLEYKNTKILIEHGDLVYLAAVTLGEEHPDMRKDLRKHVSRIEELYFDILADWDGDLDKLSGTIPILNALGDRRYRVTRSLDDVDLEIERLKVQTKIHEIMSARSKENGLLLILDDIHWADESTMMAIPYLARNIMEDRIVFCMSYRPEEIEGEAKSLGAIIESLARETGYLDIKLENLDEESLVGLVKYQLSGGDAPEELLNKLKAETGGNPFFTIEVLRALIAEGTLVEEEGVWVMKRSPKDTIPTSVVELVSRRLEALDVDSLRLIESGAILGRRFEESLLRDGFSFAEEYASTLIDRVVELNILDRIGGQELRFQHAKIQEVIYSGMSDRWKRMLHRHAGEIIEINYKDDFEHVLFKLAYHFGRTREYEKGIDYSVSAGYKATNNFAPREAIQFFERAVALIEEGKVEEKRCPEIVEQLGDLQELDGDYANAFSSYEKVLGIIENPPAVSEIKMKIGRVFQNQGNYDKAVEFFEDAISVADGIGENLLKARINGYLGKVYLRKGDYDKALALQTDYLRESTHSGDKREIGQAFMNLGGVYMHLNDYQKAVDNWKESLKWFEDARYDQGIAYVNSNLGVGHFWLGKYEAALEYYETSNQIMSKLGNVKGMSGVLNNIGVLYNDLGQHEKCLDFFRRSLQLKRKIGDTVGIANIYNNIGEAYFLMGEFGKSIDNHRLNLEMMEKADDTWGIAQALSNMAEVELELGKVKEAKDHCTRSFELAKEHSLKDIFSYDYMLMGTIACLEGDTVSADKYFSESLSYAKEIEEDKRIAMAYRSMARSFLRRGDRERALDKFSEALKVFERAQMEHLAKTVREEMQAIIDKT
jgi:tetratricopeptide (TPR) repeat protein